MSLSCQEEGLKIDFPRIIFMNEFNKESAFTYNKESKDSKLKTSTIVDNT